MAGGMDWGQDLLQGVGQRADVVLVAMGDEEAPKLCPGFLTK